MPRPDQFATLVPMTREEAFNHVTSEIIVGVVRENDAEDAWEIAKTYADHGIRSIEITLTTPDALALIARVVQRYSGKGIVVAAGTVRSSNDAAEARRAGAEVLVSPHTDIRVIEYAVEHDLLYIAGAATPTEIIHAWEAGAGLIKVYPAPQLGGPDYFRTIRQPIRDVPMLAGGPVAIESIEAYLDAGAVAVNLGGALSIPELVRSKKWEEIGRRVSIATSIVRGRRSQNVDRESVVH